MQGRQRTTQAVHWKMGCHELQGTREATCRAAFFRSALSQSSDPKPKTLQTALTSATVPSTMQQHSREQRTYPSSSLGTSCKSKGCGSQSTKTSTYVRAVATCLPPLVKQPVKGPVKWPFRRLQCCCACMEVNQTIKQPLDDPSLPAALAFSQRTSSIKH